MIMMMVRIPITRTTRNSTGQKIMSSSHKLIGGRHYSTILPGATFSTRKQLRNHSSKFPLLLMTNNKRTFARSQTIAIDRSNLINKTYSPLADTTGGKREPETPLIKYIKTKIKGAGPISVSTFMHEALLNPMYGYYYTGGLSQSSSSSASSAPPSSSSTVPNASQNDEEAQQIFGSRGDFITSPEISSMFGELIGVWCIETWNRLKCPKKLQIVELGPGRGTLMHDLLHSISVMQKKQSPLISNFLNTEISVHMVEASPQLRKIQRSRLAQGEQPQEEQQQVHYPSQQEKEEGADERDSNVVRSYCNIPVTWHNTFDKVPDHSTANDANDCGLLVIAHEFFDALPVFQFQYTDRGWCEVLVDINDDQESDQVEHFKYVLAPSQTFANILIELSTVEPKIGNRIEISPVGMGVMEQIGNRLSKQSGASLIIDYGKDVPMGFTLQGIKNHKFTNSALESPGQVDLSVFVDFSSLKNAVKKYEKEGVTSWGALNQGHFLYQMGIDVRLLQLLRNPDIPEHMIENIIGAYDRLTNDDQMGSQYKVLCVTSSPNVVPAGFDIIPEQRDLAPAPPIQIQPQTIAVDKLRVPEEPARTNNSNNAHEPTTKPTTESILDEQEKQVKKPQSIHKRPPSSFM